MSPRHPGAALRQAVRYSSAPLVALAMVMFLQQGEGTSLSLAVAGIKGQFHVSDAEVGFLPFALAAVGLFGSVPFGVLADRRRRTFLIAGSVAVWTLTMLLCGVATSFAFLFAARLGVGFVEANGPAAISLLGDYYPVEQRARKMGLYQLGSFIGALFAYVVVAVLISHGGWRYAFYTWIPLGVLGTFFMFRQPEPRRGDQELDFGSRHPHEVLAPPGPIVGLDAAVVPDADSDLARVAELVRLPEPRRVGCLDYATAPLRAVLHEVWQIRSMWYGVLSLTVAQLMLNGVSFWGIYYFEKVHHLGVAEAGLVTAVLSMGSAVGILAGGYLSDRLLRRGVVNARIYVAAGGCVAGTLLLMPAFASTSLEVTAPLFFLGGFMLTLPIAPSEAMVADVVVCELRGRANTLRTIVRTLSTAGSFIIGGISSLVGIRLALVAFTPVYGLGGLLMLLAVRHYAWDLSYVMAETRRVQASRRGAPAGPPPVGTW